MSDVEAVLWEALAAVRASIGASDDAAVARMVAAGHDEACARLMLAWNGDVRRSPFLAPGTACWLREPDGQVVIVVAQDVWDALPRSVTEPNEPTGTAEPGRPTTP